MLYAYMRMKVRFKQVDIDGFVVRNEYILR